MSGSRRGSKIFKQNCQAFLPSLHIQTHLLYILLINWGVPFFFFFFFNSILYDIISNLSIFLIKYFSVCVIMWLYFTCTFFQPVFRLSANHIIAVSYAVSLVHLDFFFCLSYVREIRTFQAKTFTAPLIDCLDSRSLLCSCLLDARDGVRSTFKCLSIYIDRLSSDLMQQERAPEWAATSYHLW